MSTGAKVFLSILLIAIGAGSFFYVAGIMSGTGFHAENIQYLEDKQSQASALSASSAGASVLVSAIPDDTATPVANKLADISVAFMLVVAAIIAEKYLLTLTGYVTFTWIIPFCCMIGIIGICSGRRRLQWLCVRLGAFGLVLVALVPASIGLSKTVENTYHDPVGTIMETTAVLEDELEELELGESAASSEVESVESVVEEVQDPSVLETIGDAIVEGASAVASIPGMIVEGTSNLLGSTVEFVRSIPEALDKAGEMVNQYMEAFAIMLVTTCVFPLLTMFALFWISRVLVGAAPERMILLPGPHRHRRRGHHGGHFRDDDDDEDEDDDDGDEDLKDEHPVLPQEYLRGTRYEEKE